MSAHCGRYPHCGCPPDYGTKCHLKDGDELLERNEIEHAKQLVWDKYERLERGGSSKKPHHKHASNYTPPKKRKRR